MLRGAVIGGVVAIGIALLLAHRDEIEDLLRRIESGDLLWLLGALAFEAVSFGGGPPRGAFLVLLYSLYIGALLVGGALVAFGVLGAVPRGLGLPALIVRGVITVVMAMILRIPGDVECRAKHLADRGGILGRVAARLATVPQVEGNAARLAVAIARERPYVLGWAFV